MTPERWRQIKSILQSSLEHEPAQRPAFLSAACQGDQALEAEILSLISAHENVGSFIEDSAFIALADTLTSSTQARVAGENIAHYKVLGHIGSGGMSESLAEDSRLGHGVALKLCHLYHSRRQAYAVSKRSACCFRLESSLNSDDS